LVYRFIVFTFFSRIRPRVDIGEVRGLDWTISGADYAESDCTYRPIRHDTISNPWFRHRLSTTRLGETSSDKSTVVARQDQGKHQRLSRRTDQQLHPGSDCICHHKDTDNCRTAASVPGLLYIGVADARARGIYGATG